MELTTTVKTLLDSALAELKGSARRLFMARMVQDLGRGGQAAVERKLGWSRGRCAKVWERVKHRFAHVKVLVVNLDNGPETHSRRTQFLQRMVDLARQTGLTIRLAYYPPYHSKYNPVERCWGILENH